MTDRNTGINVSRAEVRGLTHHSNPNVARLAHDAIAGDRDAYAFCVEFVAAQFIEIADGAE